MHAYRKSKHNKKQSNDTFGNHIIEYLGIFRKKGGSVVIKNSLHFKKFELKRVSIRNVKEF